MNHTEKATENINPRSRDIDRKTISEILEIINAEDSLVAGIVHNALPSIGQAVEAAIESLSSEKGRVIYIGAGTSGRLGVMDAAELGPTYGITKDKFFAIIAGGYGSMVTASEKAEDDISDGINAMIQNNISSNDTVVGISASGSTPYVTGALQEARRRGAATVGIACNATGSVLETADIPIALVTGPEVICGSTRMKGGSAQKMCLNMFSTAVMIKLGRVTGNFMTAMKPKNEKLKKRALFIISNICGISEQEAFELLQANDNDIHSAVETFRRKVNGPEKEE